MRRKMKQQIGWYDPLNKLFCYTTEKEHIDTGAFTVPAFIVTSCKEMLEAEDKMITIALAKTNGNKAAAARLLKMPEKKFFRKIKARKEAEKSK